MSALHAVTDTMKLCSKCGTDKPLTAFYAKSAAADGRMPSCKTCQGKRVEPAAGQWALAQLAGRYPDEFQALYEHAKNRARR